jgi:beta-lactamase regulating signal transducer with metallopeptidase domain
MTADEILSLLARVNLAAAAAIVLVLALRKVARPRFGARLAYALWLLPVLAAAAVLAPARVVIGTVPPASTDAVLMRVLESGITPASRMAGAAPAPAPDLKLLFVAAWLIGVIAATLIMILLQRRFTVAARKGATGPAVVGVIAPRIVTPANFEQTFSAEEQALVLAHERAHIERHDSRLNGLSAALQCLFWFNPLIHLAARLMRIDQEMACDEMVVRRFPNARRVYAQALVKAQLAVRPLPLGCHWPSAAEHPLVERIAMLKGNGPGRRRRMVGGAALTVLCLATALAAWASQPPQVRTAPVPASAPVGVLAADLAPATPDASQVVQPPAKAARPRPHAVALAAPPQEAVATRVAALDPPLPIAPKAPVPPPPDVRASLPDIPDAVHQAGLDYIKCQTAAARALDDGHSSLDIIATQVEARCEAQYQAYRQAWVANINIGSPEDRGWNLDNTRQPLTRGIVHALRGGPNGIMTQIDNCVGRVAEQFNADPFDQIVDLAVQQCGSLLPPPAPTGPERAEQARLDHDKAVRGLMANELRRRINAKSSQPNG